MQEHKRIEHLCLACGWRKSIPEAWSDSKPRKCPGPKCKTNFQLNPEKLASYDPENKPGSKKASEESAPKPEKKQYKKKA